MNMLSHDILVIGAGPAGGATALAGAREGARVLLVDRRQTIGVPVQCAEYIPAMLAGQMDLGKGFIVQAIRGMKTFVPGETVKETLAPGFVIRRDIFDQTLVRAGTDAGAKLMLSTRAIQRIDSKTVLLRRKNGQYLTVRAEIIVGADGPRSTVGRWVGAINHNLLTGVQATLLLARPLEYTEIYFDPEIYAGYGWLFPKKNMANIGLGLKKTPWNRAKTGQVLGRLIARFRSEGKVRGAPLRYHSGQIPAEPVRQAVHGNVALVGDAAGHTHPITGAGIFAAVTCGMIAGKWAARAVEKNDLNLMKTYDDKWRDIFEDTLRRAYQRRQMMESCWQDFAQTVKKCWTGFREYYE